MMESLKKCPFCGGEAVADYALVDVKHEGIVNFYKVKCKLYKAQANIYRCESDAIEAWNRRAE